MKMTLNPLNVKTREQTQLSLAILHAPKFRKSRAETREGRRLYNQELKNVRRAAKRHKIEIRKPLPKSL